MAVPKLAGKLNVVATGTGGSKRLITSGALTVTLSPEFERLEAFRTNLDGVGALEKYQRIITQTNFTGTIRLDYITGATEDFFMYHRSQGKIPAGADYLAVDESSRAKLIPSGTPEVEVAGIINTATPVVCSISKAGSGLEFPLQQVNTGDVTPLTENQFRLKDSASNPGVNSVFEFHDSQAGNKFRWVYWRQETAISDILNIIGGEGLGSPFGQFSISALYDLYGAGSVPERRRVIIPQVAFQDEIGGIDLGGTDTKEIPIDVFIPEGFNGVPYRVEPMAIV